jgi:hypothetical protein
MSGTLKNVRFKLAWQNFRVGDVFTPNGTLRDWLIRHGYCEIVGPVRSPVNRIATAKHARAKT